MRLNRRAALAGLLGAASAPRVALAAGADWGAVAAAGARVVEARTTPGLAVCVTRAGHTLFASGFGQANLETPAPVTPASVFKIGSITKQFTAAALLQFVQDGKLSLDDPLARFLPDYPRARDLTIRRMLSHTSGLGNYTNTTPPAAFVQTSRADYDTAALVRLMAAGEGQQFEPGTNWRYSNTAYVLLGVVLEKLAGAPEKTVLAERLFRPLGLAHTAVDDAAEVVPGRAAGYSNDPKAPGGFDNASFVSMTVPGGAGNLRSTVGDLCAWGEALAGGRVLRPAMLQAMTTPVVLNDGSLPQRGPEGKKRPVRYGFGLSLDDVRGRRCFSHNGGIQGFQSVLQVFPDERVAVALLLNTDGGAGYPDKGAAMGAFGTAVLDAVFAA